MSKKKPIHVYPINDLREHILVGFGCHCGPTVIYENGVPIVRHNSYDGREIKEKGGVN